MRLKRRLGGGVEVGQSFFGVRGGRARMAPVAVFDGGLEMRGRFGDKVRLKIIGRAPSRLRLLMGRGAEAGGVAALDADSSALPASEPAITDSQIACSCMPVSNKGSSAASSEYAASSYRRCRCLTARSWAGS